jgi:mRNA interferase MazF
VVVVTSDGFNRTESWGSIIVVPVTTSSRQQSRGPTAVALPAGTAGLNKASIVLCHQITTLDRSKIGRRIGTLPKDLLSEVEDGIRAAIDIE